MNQRRVFCVNATTMGLSTSPPQSPRDPPPELDRQPDKRDQQQQQQQQTQEEKYEEQAKNQQVEKQNIKPMEESKQQPKEETKDQPEPAVAPPSSSAQTPRPAPQSASRQAYPTINDLPNICRRSGVHHLTGGCDAAVGYSSLDNSSSSAPTTTEHYHNQLQKLRTICGEAAVTNFELNSLFVNRLKEIDSLDEQCGGDSKFAKLRLATFQDWVDLLLHVNYIIFGNMSAMEVEAYEKIMNCFQSVRGEQQQTQDENRKLRKDMCAIIKLVQHAFHHNTWNTDNMCLETLTVNQLLGIQGDQTRPESEAERVAKCMANEVAHKYDEVCHLQSQMCALDEVVQTARQKLILKDQCIAQLNQQLVELQECLANMSQELSNKTRLVKQYDEAFDTMDGNSCLFDSINEKDQQANELIHMLNKELSEFINIISHKDFQAMEYRRKLLSCFFDRINNDRIETLRKLDNLRSQLRSLDCSIDQLEVPAGCSTQCLEDDYDSQLIDGLRRRLIAINECNKKLNARCQQAEAEKRYELLNVNSALQAATELNEKNSRALKEIADLLSKLRCCDLSYEEIYTEKSSDNPFCIAIMDMYERLNELENSKLTENLQLAANDSEPQTPAHNNKDTYNKNNNSNNNNC